MKNETLLTGKFVAEALGAEWRGGNAPEGIAGAAIDTRRIAAGEIFVAIRTESRDGHDFLAAARERDAFAREAARAGAELISVRCGEDLVRPFVKFFRER